MHIGLIPKVIICEHISNMLEKFYAKIGVLRRLKRLMPHNVSLSLCKVYLLTAVHYLLE